jgi:hypothetical protein
MSYPYGLQGAPAIGTGAPGLPRRNKVRGEVLFALAGTYQWTVPEGVLSVCVLAIGPGGNSGEQNDPTSTTQWITQAGAGGALAYANDLPVTPGEVITVVAGDVGQISYFRDTSTVAAGPGASANTTAYQGNNVTVPATLGGTVIAGTGFPGGNGAAGRSSGSVSCTGGTAGGYAGPGANGVGGSNTAGNSGSGGAAASGGTDLNFAYGSGGTGPFGLGNSGIGVASTGQGGSGGESGRNTEAGRFGAGAGVSTNMVSLRGAPGCVRIVWGADRAFPSTDVGPS